MKQSLYIICLKSLLVVLCILFIGISGMSAQNLYNKHKFNEPGSILPANKQYYISLVFPKSSSGRGSIPVYSSIAGPEKKLAMRLMTYNRYMIQAIPTSARDKYYKLFNLDGKYLGYIYEQYFNLCEKPKAPEIEMVQVEGGTFEMGNNSDANASPVHQVTLSDFKIGKYEISVEQWRSIMGEKAPLAISWNDVQNYVAILNRLTGKKYRLPTEAEWEYSARGGKMSKDYVYSGSNDINKVGVCQENSRVDNGYENRYSRRKPGILEPNELGLYDMSGNEWEFCADYYDNYTDAPQANPICIKSDKDAPRVLRGGGYMDPKEYCKTRKRSHVYPWFENPSYGFRLVLGEPDKSLQPPSTKIGEDTQVVSTAEGIIVYCKDGKYGMARENDKEIIIQPKYEWISLVQDGLAIVKQEGKYGYIDKNGKQLASCDYDTIMSIQSANYLVIKNNKKGLMDASGKLYLPCDYDVIENYNFPQSFLVRKEDKIGVLSSLGKWIIPQNFQAISPMDEYGYCWVKQNEKIMLTKSYSNTFFTPVDVDTVFVTDGKTKTLVGPSVLTISPDTSKEIYYFKKGGKTGAFSMNGTINCEYDELGVISDNEFIWAKNEGGFVLLYMNGKPLSKNIYDKVLIADSPNSLQSINVQTLSFKEKDYYYVEKSGLMGVINSKGKIIVPLIYQEIGSFYENFAMVKSDGKYGFVNNGGQLAIPCQFVSANHFSDGMAAVEFEGKSGTAFINSEGTVVIKPHKYDEVGYFANGRCLVKKGNKEYYINKEGEKIKE